MGFKPHFAFAIILLLLWSLRVISQEVQTGESAIQETQTPVADPSGGEPADTLSESAKEIPADSLAAVQAVPLDTLETGVGSDSLVNLQQPIKSVTSKPSLTGKFIESDFHPGNIICKECGTVNKWQNHQCKRCGSSLNDLKNSWHRMGNLMGLSDLDSGRTRSLRLRDGNMIEGSIGGKIGTDTIRVDTKTDTLLVPTTEIMVEVAEIETRAGLKSSGAVLAEDDHYLLLATPYGESNIAKRDLKSTTRYYWDRKIIRDRIPIRNEELPDLFDDPTAYNLQAGTVHTNGFTVGYGFSNSFMLRTHIGRGFFGDLNLTSQFRILRRELLGWEANFAVGARFFSNHTMRDEASRYSHWIIDKIKDRRLDASGDPPLERVLDDPDDNKVFWSLYLVLSNRRGLRDRHGNWGWHLGFETNALLMDLPALRPDYKWDSAFSLPYRAWLGFDYDISTRIKFIAKLFADNGHKITETIEAVKTFTDFGGSPFRLEAREGTYKPLDLDLGVCWSITESLRLEMHTGFPFFSLSYRI